MFSQPPNLYHGNPHTWKESLYWNSALVIWVWTSYQIRKIVCCTSARNAGNVFPCHWLQRKLLVSDPSMHHGTCFTHVPWCMLGSLTHGGRENIPGILSACAKRNFTYLARGPWSSLPMEPKYSIASCASPWYIQWPWDDNMSWSNWRKMEYRGWWMENTMVRPWRDNLWKKLIDKFIGFKYSTQQKPYINGFVQERCSSSALAMELHLSCINPLIWQPPILILVLLQVLKRKYNLGN